MFGTIADWERDRFHTKTADDIDALPETDEPEHTAPAEKRDGNVLCERGYGGLLVELRLHTDGRCSILHKLGDGPARQAFVPREKALDAFHHPYCYLPA